MIIAILSKIVAIFIMILLGFLFVMVRLVKSEYVPAYNKLLFNVVLPIMLIYSMQNGVYDEAAAVDMLWCFVTYFVVTVIFLIIAVMIFKRTALNDYEKGIASGVVTFSNIGFMGIPIAGALFGSDIEMKVVIMNISYNIALFTIGSMVMFREEGKPLLSMGFLKKLINLPLIAALVGFAMYVTNIDLPEIVAAGISPIANMMTPLSMLIVGMQLSESNVLRLIKPVNLLLCAVKLLLQPLVALVVALLLPVSDSVALTTVFVFALPAASMPMIMAQEYGRDARFASESIVLTTFFSLAALPLWCIVISALFM